MLPIGADDIIVLAQGSERTHPHGFLADIEVAEAANLAECVCLGGLLLEAANQQHLPQHFEVELRLGAVLGGSRGSGHVVAASICSHAW